MNIWYHDEASRELDEAFEWYEVQKKDLGWRFISEAELTIKRIQNYPKSNTIITKEYRRAILPTSPYDIFYKIKNNGIEVYAIAHLHRKPQYWSNRK